MDYIMNSISNQICQLNYAHVIIALMMGWLVVQKVFKKLKQNHI
jgi:hypothetical protein